MTKTRNPVSKKPQTTKERFVDMTARLMSRHGYAGVGLNEIVAKSGAPKGSLYHHFPGGKEQLAAEAVAWSAGLFATTLEQEIRSTSSVAKAIGNVAEKVAGWMERSDFKDGSPITIIAVETGAFLEPLRLACSTGYEAWTDLIAQGLQREGRPPKEAADLALWAVASIEGAIVLSRTRKSAEPLRRIGCLLQRSLQ